MTGDVQFIENRISVLKEKLRVIISTKKRERSSTPASISKVINQLKGWVIQLEKN